MTRILTRREDARPDEELLELRVFKKKSGDILAAVVPADFFGDHALLEDMGEPALQAFQDALELCRVEGIPALWVHDTTGLFKTTAWSTVKS